MDEYGPSLVHVSARGKVLTRYVPKGLKLTGAGCPVVEALPSVLLRRKVNRGFEGLTQLPGGDLVMALQSPLSLPDTAAGEASRTTRLLRFSPRKGAVTAEYAYRFDPVGVVDPGEDDTLALINDNDFGMTDGPGAFDARGRLVDSGIETTVTYVRLPADL